MQDERQVGAACGFDVSFQTGELVGFRAVAVMKVQTRFADADDPWMLGELNQFIGRDVRTVLGVMRVRADRAPDIVKTLGDRGNRWKIR